ncbi:MAG: hypothetical protein HUK23_03115, partial [Sphaerochaetaceae bacterium]|nr:hypothetical protein [Sphaerochaetaceae bacterium]
LNKKDSDSYIIKAKSLIALGKENQALESLTTYLLLEEQPNPEDRAFAVSYFLKLNTSDKLTLMILKNTDGVDALIALYKSNINESKYSNAEEIISLLSTTLDIKEYINLVINYPISSDNILPVFVSWYGSLKVEDRDLFLYYLNEYSKLSMTEVIAKQSLTLSDQLLDNSYYSSNDKLLSTVLKIKGNILEELYDKVNARIYWNQALKLNPEDNELRNKLK